MKTTRLILSLFGATVLAVAARATFVTLNTSSLAPGGTYYVDFQLTDGSGVGNGNNTASISSFKLTGGAVGSDTGAFGGVTGSLLSTVSLKDTSFINEFFQSFTRDNSNPFSSLTFNLNLTNNPNLPAPDIFGFAILDQNLLNLGTFSLGTDQFLTVELTGKPLNYQTYAGVNGIPAPAVTVPDTGSTMLFVSMALLGLAGVRRRWVRAPLAP